MIKKLFQHLVRFPPPRGEKPRREIAPFSTFGAVVRLEEQDPLIQHTVDRGFPDNVAKNYTAG